MQEICAEAQIILPRERDVKKCLYFIFTLFDYCPPGVALWREILNKFCLKNQRILW
jgi:hypothetical protein